MALTLADLRTSAVVMPERVLIYGPPGLGKTSLACEWPNPILLDVEGGLPPGYNIPNFSQDQLPDYNAVIEALAQLYTEKHEFETVIIDTIDALEPMVWAQTCAVNKWASIESPGYGKGYVEADKDWRMLIRALNALRNDRGMKVVINGHSTVTQFDSPTSVNYSRYDIRIHKRALALVEDTVDAILFLNQDAVIKTEQGGFGKKSHHAEGGGQRWIYTEGRPAWAAKNRYGMPDRFLYRWGEGYSQMAPYFGLTAIVEAEGGLTDGETEVNIIGEEVEHVGKTF